MEHRVPSLALILALLLISGPLAACSSKTTPPNQDAMTADASSAHLSAQSMSLGQSLVGGSNPPMAQAEFSLDDYDDETQDVQISDPLEPWNRFWFKFNDVMLLKVFKPIHQGYAKIMPVKIRGGLSHFARNLAAPVRFVNSLLQGKFTQAGVEFGYFFINTVTSLGFADVASQSKPLYPYHPETAHFGHTLAVWGIPEGPYMVWPFLGPSTLRNSVGFVGDACMVVQSYTLPLGASLGITGGLAFNGLDRVYLSYEKVTKASLEPYVAIRNGYITILRQQP